MQERKERTERGVGKTDPLPLYLLRALLHDVVVSVSLMRMSSTNPHTCFEEGSLYMIADIHYCLILSDFHICFGTDG